MLKQRISLISQVFFIYISTHHFSSSHSASLWRSEVKQGQEFWREDTKGQQQCCTTRRPHPRPTLTSAAWSLFMLCEVWCVLHLFRDTPCVEITNMITDKNGHKHSSHWNSALMICLVMTECTLPLMSFSTCVCSSLLIWGYTHTQLVQ